MDNWDPAQPYPGDDPKALPPQISYPDMRELMKSPLPTRQTGSFTSRLFITPDPKVAKPYQEGVRLVFSDFFGMFDVPFQYGGGWDQTRRREAGGRSWSSTTPRTRSSSAEGTASARRSTSMIATSKSSACLAPWRPTVRFFDLNGNFVTAPEAIFLPLNFTPLMKIRTGGNSDGWRNYTINTFEDFLNAADIDWIQFWVELPTPEKQQAYREFVDNYAREQKKHGRFERPLNNRVTNLLETMGDFSVVLPQISAMAAVSVLFLAVCSLNLVGLLLGKFLARAPEISVRRALGASRAQIFLQHIVECELVGVIGGALGMLLSFG